MHRAVCRGSVELVKLLLKDTFNVGSRGKSGTTPLHPAVRYRFASIVVSLLENGADIHAQDQDGLSASDL
jgi:ankyrin repeat protein